MLQVANYILVIESNCMAIAYSSKYLRDKTFARGFCDLLLICECFSVNCLWSNTNVGDKCETFSVNAIEAI